MKAGVSIGPWAGWTTPARALPSRPPISNLLRGGTLPPPGSVGVGRMSRLSPRRRQIRHRRLLASRSLSYPVLTCRICGMRENEASSGGHTKGPVDEAIQASPKNLLLAFIGEHLELLAA